MRLRAAVDLRWVYLGGGAVVLALFLASTQVCLRGRMTHGLWLKECPDGEVRQHVTVYTGRFARGAQSLINVSIEALYVPSGSEVTRRERVSDFSATFDLVSSGGSSQSLPVVSSSSASSTRAFTVAVPTISDGHYTLRVTARSNAGTTVAEVPCPLFVPATIHVLTDRPLYEPGNVVRFRALALKASDMTPLDARPGRWLVRDPSGEVLLDEIAPVEEWGVVAGSFPLDGEAASGAWTVEWRSGDSSGSRTFDVRPFTLPRFRIEAQPKRPFYRRNERPTLSGTVHYSSGAPVAKASVEFSWSFSGDWPAPTHWVDQTGLPKTATTDASGAFRVDLPVVPEDLRGQVTVNVGLTATDAAGDRVTGSARVLLAQDPIAVDTMTELEGGLVQGFNNRLYLRATTPDGRPLPGATLTVKRLWEPTDQGTQATVDADGVASLQLDPGPPVNVVVAPMPFRPPPQTKSVERTNAQDALSDEGEASLADRLTLDRAEAAFKPCAQFTHGPSSIEASASVSSTGIVTGISAPVSQLGQCFETALRGLRFAAGQDRLLQLGWSVTDEDLPKLELSVESSGNSDYRLKPALQERVLSARSCLPASVSSAALPRLGLYKRVGDSVTLTWVAERATEGPRISAEAARCIEGRMGTLTLPKRPALEMSDEETDDDRRSAELGVIRFNVVAAAKYEALRPQATVRTAYEFSVTATAGGERLGTTTFLVDPGQVPNTRLRADAQLVSPGQTISVELLRGPEFAGPLPEELYLTHGLTSSKARVNADTRNVQFTIPANFTGWASVRWEGSMLPFFVRPASSLSLSITPQRPRYAPGQQATLLVKTSVGAQPSAAAVGLFGVDDSLSQLAPLPQADELAGLRPAPTTRGSFGGLDVAALTAGRLTGSNAIAATLLRIAELPAPPQLEAPLSLNGQSQFDQLEPLVDHFYTVLSELGPLVREWEASAPKTERMRPQTMATLWAKAMASSEKKGTPARDGFGRPLRLHRLPSDLLALVDPRAQLVDATRLPEDVENWSAFVSKEKP